MTGPGFDARLEIRAAISRLTGNQGDPRSAVHDPLATLRAATSLQAALAQAERDAARRAREDGKTWADIGEALGLVVRPALAVQSASERAFARFAADLGSGLSFAWTCRACGNLVSDHGPELGNPHDTERGHGEGCERFAAAVTAWDAQWSEGE